MPDEKMVLIRVVEWTEWMPEDKEDKIGFVRHNGVTAIPAGESERLMEVSISGTGRSREFKIDNEETGETEVRKFGCYVFQATLGQNVSAETAEEIMAKQRPPIDAPTHDPKSKLVIADASQIPKIPRDRMN